MTSVISKSANITAIIITRIDSPPQTVPVLVELLISDFVLHIDDAGVLESKKEIYLVIFFLFN